MIKRTPVEHLLQSAGLQPDAPGGRVYGARVNKNMIKIPENEFEIKFVRSSGPGGQKVNKTATKAQLRWNINKSQILAEEQKERLHRSSIIRVTKEGDLILESEETRHQPQNKEIVIQRLNELINQALKKKKKRKKVEKRETTIKKEREWRKQEQQKTRSRQEKQKLKKEHY